MSFLLEDITVNEVSLVAKGANKKKFLLCKSDNGGEENLKTQIVKANMDIVEKCDNAIGLLIKQEIRSGETYEICYARLIKEMPDLMGNLYYARQDAWEKACKNSDDSPQEETNISKAEADIETIAKQIKEVEKVTIYEARSRAWIRNPDLVDSYRDHVAKQRNMRNTY